MTPGKSIQEELPALKKLVEKSHSYFKDGYNTFNEFRRFVYESTITQGEQDVNNELGRPNIEANVVTAYQSRLCGEFSKQEPGVEVSADEGAPIRPEVIQFVEGHIRHIFDDAKKSNTQYHTYRDSISGGFCPLKVFTEYAHDMSVEQVIKFTKAKYPTMCGYDPMATESHKGDGNYSFECVPKSKQDAIDEFDIDADELKFVPLNSATEIEGYHWCFNNGQEDMLLVCTLYKKKKKKIKIMKLADGQTLTEKGYKDFLKKWAESGRVEPPPAVSKSRMSTMTSICRYVFIENKVLECKETDFKYLPMPFVDGDSIDLYDNRTGTMKQVIRPYAINVKGAQQLKNLGLQSLAGYLENIAQHKYIVMKEAIPQEKGYLDALTNLQKANTIVVNAYMDNDPNKPIPNPITPINPQACPPEISNSITMADQIIQNELGSYDAQLGINDNQLSGLAIVEAATQSQAAAMPYVVNYLAALNQVALIIVDLIPKYYKTSMTIPIIDKEGKRTAVKINQEGGIDMNYDSNLLQVKVTAGVNFAIQKSRALQQIINMCNASKTFAEFMNTKGLKVLVDNFEIRGADILKDLAAEYEEEIKQQKQQEMQMQQQMMQNNPKIMEQHTKAFTAQASAALEEKKIEVEEKKVELKEEELVIKKDIAEANKEASMARAHAEEVRAAADISIATHRMRHEHGKDVVELAHMIHGKKEEPEKKDK